MSSTLYFERIVEKEPDDYLGDTIKYALRELSDGFHVDQTFDIANYDILRTIKVMLADKEDIDKLSAIIGMIEAGHSFRFFEG